jgi:hypothetical protein
MVSHTTRASARHQNNDHEWRDGVQAVNDEAAGLLRLQFFAPIDAAPLALGALAGDTRSAGILLAIADCLRHVRNAPAAEPILCLTCPAPVRQTIGTVVCLAIPETERPTNAIASALCPNCAKRPDRDGRAVVAFRGIWPNLRPATITHPAGGHA